MAEETRQRHIFDRQTKLRIIDVSYGIVLLIVAMVLANGVSTNSDSSSDSSTYPNADYSYQADDSDASTSSEPERVPLTLSKRDSTKFIAQWSRDVLDVMTKLYDGISSIRYKRGKIIVEWFDEVPISRYYSITETRLFTIESFASAYDTDDSTRTTLIVARSTNSADSFRIVDLMTTIHTSGSDEPVISSRRIRDQAGEVDSKVRIQRLGSASLGFFVERPSIGNSQSDKALRRAPVYGGATALYILAPVDDDLPIVAGFTQSLSYPTDDPRMEVRTSVTIDKQATQSKYYNLAVKVRTRTRASASESTPFSTQSYTIPFSDEYGMYMVPETINPDPSDE